MKCRFVSFTFLLTTLYINSKKGDCPQFRRAETARGVSPWSPSSVCEPAAVHVDAAPRHVRAGVAGQEKGRVGDLVGRAVASQRGAPLDVGRRVVAARLV